MHFLSRIWLTAFLWLHFTRIQYFCYRSDIEPTPKLLPSAKLTVHIVFLKYGQLHFSNMANCIISPEQYFSPTAFNPKWSLEKLDQSNHKSTCSKEMMKMRVFWSQSFYLFPFSMRSLDLSVDEKFNYIKSKFEARWLFTLKLNGVAKVIPSIPLPAQRFPAYSMSQLVIQPKPLHQRSVFTKN